MFDRIPENPGRVKITPESGGAAYYATMERADNPVQEGTPLNKATLLTDETAALYSFDGNAVPDDIFESLYDARNKVGDTKVTLRTDLDDKWVLANGALLDVEKYPKLAELLPEPKTLKTFPQSNIPAYYNGADYANGICVAAGTRAGTNGSVRWVGSIDGINKYTLTDSSGSYYHTVQYDYDSDTWVMAYYCSGTAYSHATKDPVNGTWTSKTISDLSGKFAHMYCYNGLWVAIGVISSRNQSREVTSSTWVSTTTDPINGTWSTAKQIGSRGAGNPEYACVYCHDGVWVIATGYEESASAGGGGGIVTYTTTDPVNGTWTMKTVAKGTQSYSAYSVQAHEGEWVMTAYNGYTCLAYTTTDPVNGTWTGYDLKYTYNNVTYNAPFFVTRCLRWYRGKWYALSKASGSDGTIHIISTKNIGGTWDVIVLGSDAGRSLCTDGNVLVAMYSDRTYSNYASYLAYHVPAITTDGAYTYIKAKE